MLELQKPRLDLQSSLSLHLRLSLNMIPNQTRYRLLSDCNCTRLGMEETRGKLRSDLEIHSEANSGIVVKDPITNRFYRFTPVQASVLELLDGRHDFASIASIASEKHQTDVLEGQVREFAQKLHALLLMDNPYCWTKLENAAKTRRRAFRSLLSIKIHAFNPDRLLTKLEKRLRFCFGLTFSIIIWLATFIALVISILNWESLFVSLGTLFSLYSIPLVIVVIFLVMTVHEFGHGLTLKHFGGKVEEMGFMLLYFIPAFYCNVSDAWMLKKRERIWVTLAGAYIQMFLWALATIAWRLLAVETPGSTVCIVIIAVTGIQTLLNLNPLIRLDGYYLLSDWVEVPNLRPKALGYLKNRFKSIISGTAYGNSRALSRKERRLFFYYGTASFLFTALLVAFMFQRVGGWIIREYHTWGIVFASMLFLAIIPTAKKEKAETSRRLFKTLIIRIRKAPLVFMCLILVLFAVALMPWELKISGDFVITAEKRMSVTPQVVGNLRTIYVDQGSRVHRGELLADIENLELSNEYEETKGELATQKADLDLLKAGSRPEEIEKARRLVATKKAELYNASRIGEERALLRETIAKKEAELANARLNYERTQSLLENGLIARNEADRNRTAYEVQQKELSEAKGQLSILEEQTQRNEDIKRKELAQAESELNILLAGSRKESIRAAESQVNKLKEKLNILEQQKELLKIRSPIDGTVATPYLQNRIGDFLDKGDMFCEIVSDGTVIIEMPVPEKEIGDIKVGFPITIKVRGYPNRWYEARVRNIAPVAAVNGMERTVMVQGELGNSDGSLKAGMTGVGKILCGKRPIFEIASRRAIRWLRTEFWEYLP
jgi:putative peptide zinc metalloprotease protein